MAKVPVGDFYVHLLQGQQVLPDMISSNKLLRLANQGRPTVIDFYDSSWGGCRPCAVQMEMWARTIPNVQFLAVCVESQGVAKLFDRMFDFQKVLNCYIPARQYFPHGFGQLGCGGFIISDADGNFVSRKTRAYTEYGELAFREVEAILASLVTTTTNSSSSISNTSSRSSMVANNKEEKGDDDTSAYEHCLPPLIGIASMDHEHEACAKALMALLDYPTKPNLRVVLKELQNHFAHEEALMVKYRFGGTPGDAFSAVTSHVKDHKRILGICENGLSHKKNSGAPTSADDCGDAWHAPVATVPRSVVTAIIESFHQHASQFDALYEHHIPSTAA
jgi:hypothetical protein